MTVAQRIGQLIVGGYSGTKPPVMLLGAIEAGRVGSVILMGDNTGHSRSATAAITAILQRAARAGHNSGLLIMTDQEGGEVRRLPGPPDYAAAAMGEPQRAATQGYATAKLLRSIGVNVDLAPVADVGGTTGFMGQEQREFGTSAAQVATAACAFAGGLRRDGVAFTLKHFPGLGNAVQSTDDVPVDIGDSAATIRAKDAAYRKCGHGALALVMISSASYAHLTGSKPAVLSSTTYRRLLPSDDVKAVTISDSFESGAIRPWSAPARTAIGAGLDMVMYPDSEADTLHAASALVADVHAGHLSAQRVKQATAAVLALKAKLGLAPNVTTSR
jgi:beta-N-acetylhexosaminidase